MKQVFDFFASIVVLGIITPFTAFLIVLNKHKEEIWGRIVFNETDNKGNDKGI